MRKKTGRNSKLKDIEAQLVDPVLLQEWGRFSSYERCIKIKQKFGVECSPTTLRRCYAKNKVGYRNTVEVKRRAKEAKEEFDQKRVVFAQFLQSLVREGKEVIYMDESQFHSWMSTKKAWSLSHSPVEVILNNRQHGVSVFGAIGYCLKESVFLVAERNNKENFIEFMKMVKEKLKNKDSKPFVVLDNAASHRATISQEFL